MKITNEQLKQIIKEELEVVMNESETLLGLYALAALRKKRAAEAAAKRKAAQEPLPRGGYKRGYGGPSSSNYEAGRLERERERAAKAAAEQEAMDAKNKDDQYTLKRLADLKMKVYIQQGCTGEESCRVSVRELNQIMGSGDIYTMLGVAENYGKWDDEGYNDEYTSADLSYLFPGEHTPDQLPVFDRDSDDFYSDDNYQSLVSGGYMDDDHSYDFTSRGKEINKLLGLD